MNPKTHRPKYSTFYNIFLQTYQFIAFSHNIPSNSKTEPNAVLFQIRHGIRPIKVAPKCSEGANSAFGRFVSAELRYEAGLVATEKFS
jgi:hypothetical protein